MNTQTRKEFWHEHIQNWEKSGLPKLVYCKENNINIRTFYVYYKNYNKRNNPKSDFISLAQKITNKKKQFKITLSNGMEMSFPEIPNPHWFGKLIQEIESSNV